MRYRYLLGVKWSQVQILSARQRKIAAQNLSARLLESSDQIPAPGMYDQIYDYDSANTSAHKRTSARNNFGNGWYGI